MLMACDSHCILLLMETSVKQTTIAFGLVFTVTAQAVIPSLQPMPSACVVDKAPDLNPPRCDDGQLPPKAAAALTVAVSTGAANVTYMPVIKFDAITDVEYLIDLREQISLVQQST